jgi:hypothetical protein
MLIFRYFLEKKICYIKCLRHYFNLEIFSKNNKTIMTEYFKENKFMHNNKKILNFLIIFTLLLFLSYFFVKTPDLYNVI